MAEPSEGGGVVMPPLGILGLFFGTTDFESKTHEEMLAMVKAANPETLKTLSDQLTDAGKTITEIGEDLRAYIKGVRWEGEAGKAMELWGDQAWKATLQLGTYSTVGGTWIGNAAQTLREVKANLPDKDATAQANYDAAVKYRNDPDSEDIRREAWSKMTEDHAQAVQQMNKLAQSYSFSTFVISAAEPPTFPPPPGQFVPRADEQRSEYIGTGTGRTSGTERGTGEPYLPASHKEVNEVRPDSPSTVRTETVVPRQDRPVDMGIDSVDTLPPQTQIPQTPVGTPPVGRPETNVLPPVVGIPPMQGGKTTGPASVPPGGSKGFPNARNVVSPSGGGINSRMPRDSGITGGRPVPPSSGRPTGGIPRSNVIGGDSTARGLTGRGMSHMPGMPGGPAGTGQGGAFGGRRLASEGGGMVGGRPSQSGQAGARPFTAGGSGLVRGTPAGGAGAGQVGRTGPAGAGANSSRRRRDDEQGERPDYLSEDEETWQQGSRRIVPPVID
jgi:hypothetical protein